MEVNKLSYLILSYPKAYNLGKSNCKKLGHLVH